MCQSYKIFVRDKPLLFLSPGHNMSLDGYENLDASAINDIQNLFIKVNRSRVKAGFYLESEPEDCMQKIRGQLKLIQAAGGMVWNLQNDLLMIHRRGRWDLPKGRVEANETLETAAIREVMEECGVGHLRIIRPLDTSLHVYIEANEWVLKETFWYEMRCQDTGPTRPQALEGITEARWVPKREIGEKLKDSYGNIRALMSGLHGLQ